MADNIYMKLAKMRVELQKMNIKKSGKNTYSGYDYYELADILPPINELQDKYKTCSYISFSNEVATLVIVNSEAPEEQMMFTSPMAELSLKAANPIQNLGGVETYQRRYLYMTAFEIVENDYFDATQGKENAEGNKQQRQQQKQPPKKPASKLSEAVANELNRAIKEHSAMFGVATKDVTARIVKEIGKPIGEITDADAKKVLELIEKWAS